tara:strand:+ start:954 stop:1520 length:567 start_codon:yes stop_codon:yes gene_type:complete
LKNFLENFNIIYHLFNELEIKDLFLIKTDKVQDNRGTFVKPFTQNTRRQAIATEEIYYSISKKNVLRGMHFQVPPYHCSKLIYVVKGAVLDVLVDLRVQSPTFKKVKSLILSENKNSLLIPPGIGHGFLALEDDTIMVYNQSKVYDRKHDDGILWSSIDFDWPISNPILSDRDKSFKHISEINDTFNL